MGCTSSQDAKDGAKGTAAQQPHTNPAAMQQHGAGSPTVMITVQPADGSGGSKKGPTVKLSRAQELAVKRRDEERQEEERKKKLAGAKLADGPAVRTTRATEMARDSKVREEAAGSGTMKGSRLGPNGIMSDSATFELPPMDVKTFSDDDFVGYKIGKLLGKGSFGSSYECTLQNNTVCCVKIIEFGGVADAAEVANLRSEIKLMKRLVHPHIVQYYGCIEDSSKKTIAIFMELVTGGTLTQYLKQYTKVPRGLLQNWVRQMLLGIKYLHDSGIVHRDIKGANILMTADGTIRLADFGCSKSIDETCSKTRGCSTMVGTPYWMAPEVLKSQPYGAKADIWSLACTIVEMLTGKPPWPEMPNMWAAVYKIANSNGPPPGIPKDLPRNLGRFLERCFERNPALRASADELLQHPYITETLKENASPPTAAVAA